MVCQKTHQPKYAGTAELLHTLYVAPHQCDSEDYHQIRD